MICILKLFVPQIIKPNITNGKIRRQAQYSITYPTLSGTFTVLSESFFDDYSWESRSDININQLFTTNFNNNNDLPVIWSAAYPLTDSLTAHTRGLATGMAQIPVMIMPMMAMAT